MIFFVYAIVTDNQIDDILLKLAYNWKWVHFYTCNFYKMHELKFMKFNVHVINQKLIYFFVEQRERTEQTEDGGHVTEH